VLGTKSPKYLEMAQGHISLSISNPSARAQMNTSHSLTSHYLIGNALMDLGEDLISLLCLVLNAITLVRCRKSENLDAMNGGWLGVFIAPTTKLVVW
jgi:hypothetical protein